VIEFEVRGEPVPAGRPRAGKTRKGRTVLYDPAKSRNFKQYVKLVASQHAPKALITGPIILEVDVFRPIPKSFSKKKASQAEEKRLRPTTKPDTSNYVKLVEDALNGVIYKDDSQIVSLIVKKFYSGTPRIRVLVDEIEIGEVG
jgi:Holliday junction resolvase RusA-like endonuclease